MRIRFFLIALLLACILSAWTYINYEFETARKDKIAQMAELPIYIYVADSTKVAPLMTALADFSGIRSINLETGHTAATELSQAYQLPISERMLSDFHFPDIVTLHFKANKGIREERPRVLDMISSLQISRADVDSQSNAWNILDGELRSISLRWMLTTIFNALIVLLIFIFIRLSYELRFLLLQKRQLVSVADSLRFGTLTHRHTWTLLLFPMAVNAGIYYGMVFMGYFRAILPWWFFAIQLATQAVGSVVLVMILHIYLHDKTFVPDLNEVE